MRAKKQLNGSADEVETAFYDALSRADLEALMLLWADDEEIVCIHPGAARLIGHAAIRASWEAILAHGSVHIVARKVHVVANMLTAVHSIIEQLEHAVNDRAEVHIVATNVYIKTPLGWRITMHHASGAVGQAPAEHSRSAVLH
ncbi:MULTISPECIES: YybH family protein [unclassified Undibacterium]|uniref:YybH family protein n=1 Tax=unclassified Undibacterium TaxID=2630295 RepID=UPI002AC91F87|nr:MULTISPECIES: nuclear transport factor 2 family protein [unclassified Undibacterium]MEB0139372.1 nuclear transport factor 2 family protein [Undibacterium sp. CCC2.1]MEB0173363.1 nuclear transport factor 2 family protein [Undibacterium sp. CCC1.1]MEB0177250.1 nuclear transport factor 2 family protein [Undibacterium sp. CCC3.4]MEB0216515.1 nuclear transport factor 2 family protein [Undibacterium sp. 5I2]WPX45577.1 nuclear transport factor 2 family protein [Undibacterium sp. CCC3.4]